MTFIRKFSGKTERDPDRIDRIVCCYTCPEHGEFDAEVQRDEKGEAPDSIMCGAELSNSMWREGHPRWCDKQATWTASPVAGRVRRVEVVRGKWERPERSTFLDTRRLGEGQPVEEFQAERKRIWTEERRKRVKEMLR